MAKLITKRLSDAANTLSELSSKFDSNQIEVDELLLELDVVLESLSSMSKIQDDLKLFREVKNVVIKEFLGFKCYPFGVDPSLADNLFQCYDVECKVTSEGIFCSFYIKDQYDNLLSFSASCNKDDFRKFLAYHRNNPNREIYLSDTPIVDTFYREFREHTKVFASK